MVASALSLQASVTSAEDAKKSVSSEVQLAPQKVTLPNGFTALLAPDATATRVTARLVWDLGVKDDPKDIPGLSEVIEPLLADPSTRHVRREQRGALERALGIEEWQTDVGAGFDQTHVTLTVPNADVNLALWMLADRMGFVLDGVEDPIVSEKASSVVPRGWDAAATFRLGRAALFGKDHPYGGSFDLRALTAKAVRAQMRRHLVPRNAILALAGAFDAKDAKARIEEYFGPLADLPKPAAPAVPKVALTSERRVRGEAAVPLPEVGVLWATAPFIDAEDAAFDALSYILDERLTKKHVDGTKAATFVNAHQSSMVLGSVFEVHMRVAAGHTEQEIEGLIEAEVEKLRAEGPTADEARRATRQYVLTRTLDLTRSSQRAYAMSILHFAKGDAGFAPGWVAQYETLTAEKIRAAAQKYLGKSQRVVVTITPNPRAPSFGRPISGGGL